MLRKSLVFITIVSLTVLFIGCKQGEVNTSLYVGDLKEIVDEKKENQPYKLTTELVFPVPGEKWFKNNKSKIQDILSKYFGNYTKFKVASSGMDTMVTTNIKLPLYSEGPDKGYSLVNLYVRQVKSKNVNVLTFKINRDRLSQLENEFDRTFMVGTFDLNNFNFNFTLRNDLREKFKFKVENCYVDGTPNPFLVEYKMDPRSNKEITLSSLIVNFSKLQDAEIIVY